MDYAACNIVYVDRTAGEDGLIKRKDLDDDTLGRAEAPRYGGLLTSSKRGGAKGLNSNIKTLLGTFSEAYICTSGRSCISKLAELHDSPVLDFIPTLVLVDIPFHDSWSDSEKFERTPSPSSREIEVTDSGEGDFYGISLLQRISSDIQQRNLSKLFIPVAVVAMHDVDTSPQRAFDRRADSKAAVVTTPLDQRRTVKFLDMGAIDVLTSPLLPQRLPSLAIHAYNAHKESSKEHRAMLELKRGRKRSWVGLDDQKPYAYLREAMVSGLMDGICRLRGDGDVDPVAPVRIAISAERRQKIKTAISSWYFSAHDFSDDELLHAAMLMLQHALALPELEQWRIPTENLIGFLVACRAAYNAFVPYHNFRHVIDVLQACFHFLVQIGVLPLYPAGPVMQSTTKSPIAALLRPFDALTLLITAIGHDVGHPGVNNAFLVTLNAPLAQLYNDRSVLESFHCAAYSQILRRHWPAAFSGVEMRQLMISSILATDMGLHFEYMKKLGFMQEKLAENHGTDGWNGRLKEEYRTLACSLLIKCADISNVARRYDVASQWTLILTDEFSRQAQMEADLGIPSALFAPPVREPIELGHSQIGFMNMFAIPLFQGVTHVMPAMEFCVEELHKNVKSWEQRIEVEQLKKRKDSDDSVTKDAALSLKYLGTESPRTLMPKKSLSESPVTPRQGGISGQRTNGIYGNVRASPRFKALSDLPSSSDDEFSGYLENESLLGPSFAPSRHASRSVSAPLHTTSAPVLVDHPSRDTSYMQEINDTPAPNGMTIAHDAIREPPFSPSDAQNLSIRPRSGHAKYKESIQQRSSDGSASVSNSNPHSTPASNDWASQATSATTSKLPLSPSTQATSIMSQDSASVSTSVDQASQKTETTPPASSHRHLPGLSTSSTRDFGLMMGYGASSSSPAVPTSSMASAGMDADRNGNGGGDHKANGQVTIMESVRSLAKKPSRSRFKFWKKKPGVQGLSQGPGQNIPPMPGAKGSEDSITSEHMHGNGHGYGYPYSQTPAASGTENGGRL